jgi:hypothetical protein
MAGTLTEGQHRHLESLSTAAQAQHRERRSGATQVSFCTREAARDTAGWERTYVICEEHLGLEDVGASFITSRDVVCTAPCRRLVRELAVRALHHPVAVAVAVAVAIAVLRARPRHRALAIVVHRRLVRYPLCRGASSIIRSRFYACTKHKAHATDMHVCTVDTRV